MNKPGKYEYMAVVREIEKLKEIKDPTRLKQQQETVQEFKQEYGEELFEQMVKDADVKYNNHIQKSQEEINSAFQEFCDMCDRITKILKDDELYEKECFDYVNKLGRYANRK